MQNYGFIEMNEVDITKIVTITHRKKD